MGQQKTIYVKDADTELWRRAEAYAKARRLTMSALIMTALEEYLVDAADAEDPKR